MDNPEDPNSKSCLLDETTLSTPGIAPRTGFSLKEYEEQLNALKKENFNLKLRIYFAEERKEQMKSIKSIEDAQQRIIDLNVQLETLRKELSEKDELIVETAKAMNVLQRSYQTKSEALHILSSQKAQLESQNEVLKKDLMDLKLALAAADQSTSSQSSSSPSQPNLLKKKSQTVASQQTSFTELTLDPKSMSKNSSSSTSKLEDSQSEIVSLREQLSKVLAENTKAMETIQYLMRTNKRLRQQQQQAPPKTGSPNHDQVEEQREESDRLLEELKAEVERLNCELHEARKNSLLSKQEMKKWISNTEGKDRELNKIVQSLDEKNSRISELEQELRELELKLQLSEEGKDHREDDSSAARENQELKCHLNHLQMELKKRTHNLQELVNKELWNKNREIEKLNKLCEQRQNELSTVKLALKLRSNDPERILVEKHNDPNIIHAEEFKENSKPCCAEANSRYVMLQLEAAIEEKAKLVSMVKELRKKSAEHEIAERMVVSLRDQCAKAKAETEAAEKLLKESTNACQLLTTRLEELAGFMDSLLSQDNFLVLSEEKKQALKEAVNQSRLLSKSLSASFNNETTFNADNSTEMSLKCPSVEPILPDYSEINFSSEEDNVADVTLEPDPWKQATDEADAIKSLRSEVMSLTEKLKATDLDLDGKDSLHREIDSDLPSSENNLPPLDANLINELSCINRFDPMFSINGRMTHDKIHRLPIGTSARFCKKISVENSRNVDILNPDCSRNVGGCTSSNQSESESWSEPDRTTSLARIGLTKESIAFNKPCSETETSDLEDFSNARLPGKKSKKIYGKSMKQKLRSFKEMNTSLRQEIQSLHSVLASVSSKISDEEMMKQLRALNTQLSRSHSKCGELEKQLIIANTRCQTLLVLLEDAEHRSTESRSSEKHVKSLEQECQSLKSKLDESNAEIAMLVRFKDEKNTTARELERAKADIKELSTMLGNEKESRESLREELLKEKNDHISARENISLLKEEVKKIQCLLQERSECILEKECALLETQNKLKECAIEFEMKMKESNDRCMISEKRVKEVENYLLDATNKLKIAESKVKELTGQLEVAECALLQRTSDYENLKSRCEKEVSVLQLRLTEFCVEEEKNAELHKNVLVEMSRQVDDLKRERQEALNLVENWQAKVNELMEEKEKIISSKVELEKKSAAKAEQIARETEAGLRYQLQAASSQCAYAESHARNLEKQYKLRERELKAWYSEREAELRRQLDNATLTTSEVVLDRTRLANDKLRLQQELRNRDRHKTSKYEEELERVKRDLERRVAELEAANGEMEAKLTNIYVYKESYSDCENTSAGEESLLGSPVQITPLNLDSASDAQTSPKSWRKGNVSPGLKTCISTLTYHNHVYMRQRSNENSSDYVSDQELALPLQLNEKCDGVGTCSPDLGIESDQGRTSSNEQVALCKSNSLEFNKLEEENVSLRNKLFRTKQALEETLTQLSTANKKKRQVENAICKQLHKTHHILKKARVNLELRTEGSVQNTSSV